MAWSRCLSLLCACLQIGDVWGVGGIFLSMLDKLKRKWGAIDTSNGGGTANTALVWHAKRILALNEGDQPYQVRGGT